MAMLDHAAGATDRTKYVIRENVREWDSYRNVLSSRYVEVVGVTYREA